MSPVIQRFARFDSGDFDVFCTGSDERDEAYNAPLYAVFQVDPEHADEAVTWVKFNYVEKLYSAGLRRHVKVRDDPHAEEVGAINVVMEWIFAKKQRVVFREIFADGLNLGAMFSSDNLNQIINIHTRFGDCLSGVTRDANICRSFCSKYLHFQFGVFPVYDRFAKIGLKRQIGRSSDQFHEYADYVKTIYQLLTLAFDAESFSTEQIKHLDHYLVRIGRAPVQR